MKRLTLHFGVPKDITPRGLIGAEISFPFTAVDTELLGLLEEKQYTTEHRMRVEATAVWVPTVLKMEENEDIVKVIFEVGKRQLVKSLQRGEQLKDEFNIKITTETHPRKMPFDPNRLELPYGQTVTVEIRESIGYAHTL